LSSAAIQPPAVGDVGAGHTLGRYELLLPIASGGMAMVWAARLKGTRGFQKIVAVKTMLPKLSEDASFEQMFLDEASLASQIRHPHIVEILDLGEQDHVLYLVMEWIDGVPLNQVIKAARQSGGIPLPIAVRICVQALQGLHAAHELTDSSGQLVGLVHRDVSPQNLLVTYDGVTKVVDFGVAKATASGASATQAGQIKGKIAYMAPEQVKGHSIDRRVDVFALGVVLYALTTGKHPFRKDNDANTMYQICSPEPAVSPRRIVPGFPMQLERVLMQSLAKNPVRRFPTANDFLVALDQSLPTSMRVSSDEEVAKFVRSLFGDRREQQKAELQAALERADERARNGGNANGLRQILDSPPAMDRHSMPSISGTSGVSEVSLVTEARASGVGTGPHSEESGIGPGPGYASGAPTEIVTRPKSRLPLALALLATLVAIGAVAALFLQKSAAGPAATAAATTATAPAATPSVAPPTETAAPAATESAEPVASTEAPEPAPSASAAETKTAKKPGVRWVAPPPTAKPTATAAPTSKKPNPQLKVDKVFE
jgi:serine/threonine protein kinase